MWLTIGREMEREGAVMVKVVRCEGTERLKIEQE